MALRKLYLLILAAVRRLADAFRAARIPGSILGVAVVTCTFANAWCPVDVVVVRGRVEHAPGNAKVRVQLVYSRDVVGDSGEATIEDGRFSVPIEFLTQSRRPVAGFLEKCSRRPTTVIVTLVPNGQDHEYDRVSLDFAKDFMMSDPSAYSLRSELVLHGSR